jgi:predicted nuclease with RNAse H fold
VITVGVDLAAQPANTVVATLVWRDGGAIVKTLAQPANDAIIIDAVLGSDSAGIDAPFGWPEAYWEFLTRHRDDEHAAFTDAHAWRPLAFRRTDLHVTAQFKQTPLSVSTDRLGLTAMRCASVLAQLRERGFPIDRSGAGRVSEVYPAVALRQWGLPFKGYKGKEPMHLHALVDALCDEAPWLELGEYRDACRTTHDALDAVVAGLVARAQALGNWSAPMGDDIKLAQREGWIVVPMCTLKELA